jgi:F0F1-type ATP synthase assembly protein I
VDTYIGQPEMAEKRGNARDPRMTVATTLVGAVLGWLTASLATPNTMLHATFSLFAR